MKATQHYYELITDDFGNDLCAADHAYALGVVKTKLHISSCNRKLYQYIAK
jgi:hypothetical protein